MKNISLKMWVLFFSILFLDQFLKVLVKTNMSIGDEIIIFDWFIIYFVENNGFAFGLEFFGFWGKFFLTLFRIVFVVFIFKWLFDLLRVGVDFVVVLAFLLISAGAIGNIIDRIFRGYVVDFIDFHLNGMHWYVFNVADSSVTIGLIFLLYSSILVNK